MMSGWTDRLASALTVPPVDPRTQDRMLDASRDIAHHAERKDTPISTFLMGVAVGSALAGGTSFADAIDEALEIVRHTLAEERGTDAG
jgi:hypothetical protein